ncbi:unnamed protein product, partial [Ectocarpus fasciculatus]
AAAVVAGIAGPALVETAAAVGRDPAYSLLVLVLVLLPEEAVVPAVLGPAGAAAAAAAAAEKAGRRFPGRRLSPHLRAPLFPPLRSAPDRSSTTARPARDRSTATRTLAAVTAAVTRGRTSESSPGVRT